MASLPNCSSDTSINDKVYINSSMVNLTVGNCEAKFDTTTSKLIFCWELSVEDIKKIKENNGTIALSPPIKGMEQYSDDLLRAHFSIKYENGYMYITAKIEREKPFAKTDFMSSTFFAINGGPNLYGSFFSPKVLKEIMNQNGTVKIFADLNDPDFSDAPGYENVPDYSYDENEDIDLPYF